MPDRRRTELSYVLRMKNCAFFARHGVHAEEETLGQRFYVDAELRVNPDGSLADDSIANTVDYGIVFAEIERIITGRRRHLIEALALDVAQSLCRRFPQIAKASITVRKPNAPVAGVLDHVEVTVAWPE
ncbi:dihydroneopterin aldolase [Chelativorans sp. ZYF759]|uniref:dihydroneopterin aldolase n=1 Tax=Chelativorans sp. ZYF759 TaxID=2692213 RepID=UPI001FEFC322|nr:dihydroneopterin aldolase [Chelativorans sp. ZYF759]